MAPAVFVSLLGSLWGLKCVMMVLFQNKILWLPNIPPGAREEEIETYSEDCAGIQWQKEEIMSLDGTKIALCVATEGHGRGPHVYVLYFQGNASSLPPRLPDLSSVMRRVVKARPGAAVAVVAVSYRGYWTSKGRPSESGIDKDAKAALQWLTELHASRTRAGKETAAEMSDEEPVFILWGQSVGCGVATNLAAASDYHLTWLVPKAIVLETPFTSVKDMLKAMYPEKWLPYGHLHPFLRNFLDTHSNLGRIAERRKSDGAALPHVVIVDAAKDEVVPPDHAPRLRAHCEKVGLPVCRTSITSALHSGVAGRPVAQRAITDGIMAVMGRTEPATSDVKDRAGSGQ